ncbi:MAG: tetratricopeptide repeat protein [Bacteroidetes bacterium]|jgi:tetratricopeptide (TPR) repeat protein|nr:tetratricopeptide repeat protein [Bacteroidota bacterium]
MTNKSVYRLLFSLGLFLVLVNLGCTVKHGPSSSEDALQKDTVQIDKLSALNEAIRSNPADPGLYLARAEELRARLELKDAFEDAERALKLDSLLPEAHHEIGLLYYLDGQIGLAKFAFEKALVLDDQYIPSMLQLAEIYLVLENYDRALNEVNRVLKVDEQTSQAYFLKGLIYRDQDNAELAKSSFQTATELDPEGVEAFNLLGMQYAEEGDTLAMSYYNTVLDIDSTHKEALYNRAYFLQEIGRADDAIEAYDLLLRFYPNTAVAWYNKGYIYFGYLGDAEASISSFSKAIDLEPGYAQAYFNRGVAYEENSERANAIRDYEKVLSLDPGSPQALTALNRLK